MLSLTHFLLIVLICVLIFGPNKLPRVGRSIGEGLREMKKSMRGEADIDITDSVKRLEDHEDKNQS